MTFSTFISSIQQEHKNSLYWLAYTSTSIQIPLSDAHTPPMSDLRPVMSFNSNWLSISMETPRGHGEWTFAPDMRNEPNYSFWEVIICALRWQGPINNVGSAPCACSVIEEQWGGSREPGARPIAIAPRLLWSLSPQKKGRSVSHTKLNDIKHQGYKLYQWVSLIAWWVERRDGGKSLWAF